MPKMTKMMQRLDSITVFYTWIFPYQTRLLSAARALVLLGNHTLVLSETDNGDAVYILDRKAS